MTDQAQVMSALESQILSIVYPSGTSNPSIVGVDVTIGQGWPTPATLDPLLISHKALISIYPTNIVTQKAQFLRTEWEVKSISPVTIIPTILNNTITITGTVSVPQHVMGIVNDIPYVYEILITDTLESIASGLAALIPSATATGNVITIGGLVYKIEAKTIVKGIISQEVSRTNQVFSIYIWCDDHTVRDTLGAAINAYFSKLVQFDTSDGYNILVWVVKDNIDDSNQEARLYKRCVQIKAQFPITVEEETTVIGYIGKTIELVNEIT